jgi:cardiolipin synthase
VNPSQLPNIISVLRMLLVLPVVWALLNQAYATAVILFAVAGISDGLDGFLAKHFGWQSRLGSILDPLADKLLLVSCFITLAWLDFIPLWLVLVVLGRDLIIVMGGWAFHHWFGAFELRPSRLSKLNTFMQIVFVLAVVFYHGHFAFTSWIIEVLGYIVFATTFVSGMDYIWIWGRRALDAGRRTQ